MANDHDDRSTERGVPATTPHASVLHPEASVLSRRHVPTWLALALAAGSVNAAAFMACQRFVTHVTGTATTIGLDVGTWRLALEYGVVLACFVAGAAASVLAIDARIARGKRPLHGAPLVVTAALLVVVALAGTSGLFGAFGTSVERAGDFLLLSLLSFAMGLQNATVATSTGLMIRTTHMTGPASDLGVYLATAMLSDGERRRGAVRSAALRAGKIVAFVAGAAITVPLARVGGYLAFLAPAAVILAAAASSFVPSRAASAATPRLAT